MKIYAQKNGCLNEADIIELAKLLFKAGYSVSQKREQVNKKNIRVLEFNLLETKLGDLEE